MGSFLDPDSVSRARIHGSRRPTPRFPYRQWAVGRLRWENQDGNGKGHGGRVAAVPFASTDGGDQGSQRAGVTDVSGFVHSGPRPVFASGRVIIASGPALCSPLNGVGTVTSKPQSAASFGSLNQKPTSKVPVGASETAGSKPKI